MSEQNIQELSLEAVMGERFGRYSKYIIQERALPDIRDGLKPVNAGSYLQCTKIKIHSINHLENRLNLWGT